MSESSCPRCGKMSEEFQTLDAALLIKIQEAGNSENLPSSVCSNCFKEVAGGIARGSVLLAREKARDQKKLMLWKSRVNLIKKARQCMIEKSFSEAAVAYEKYLKVLEVVFDVKPGELSPEQFRESAKTQELTVVASVYWDLLRIYDTSEKYGERQANAAKKLSQFLRFTPIFPDIVRKAETFQRTAKNPAVIKSFLKAATTERGRCFIATSAFQYESPEVVTLCRFRDQVLAKNPIGIIFIHFYYLISPSIAWILDNQTYLKHPVRKILQKIVSKLPQ